MEIRSRKDINRLDKIHNFKWEELSFISKSFILSQRKNITQVKLDIREENNIVYYTIRYKGIRFNPWDNLNRETVGGGGFNALLKMEKFIENRKYIYCNGLNVLEYSLDIQELINSNKRIEIKELQKQESINEFSININLNNHDYAFNFNTNKYIEKIFIESEIKNINGVTVEYKDSLISEMIMNIATYSKHLNKVKYIIKEDRIEVLTKREIPKEEADKFVETFNSNFNSKIKYRNNRIIYRR